jgi:hypothetical protein
MTPDLLCFKLIESDITSEHLKRVYDMALFERDPEKEINHEDLQAIRRLHDLIGLVASLEIDFESKLEDLNG